MLDLSGKNILVTGASSGLGRSISKMAAAQGATLILIGRDAIRLEETRITLKGSGHSVFSCDIGNMIAIEEITNAIIEGGIRINGFVHCAGIEKTLPIKSSNWNVFQKVFNINVFAGFEFARLLSQKNIVDLKGASFVFISSIKGKLGSPFNVAYCASKSALLAGSRAIALELAAKKIRCNCVLPGLVETEMVQELFKSISVEVKEKLIKEHPLGIGHPNDIAAIVIFLLSDEAKWITGAEYIIDGGFSIH